jgi:zinc transport system ATP-binding protein
VLKTPDPLVSLQGAGLQRGGRWLVRGVDFLVRSGEIVTLIGPNGSGKTTTARLALGVIACSEGHVRRRAGLRAAYVPQKMAVDWALPLRVQDLMVLTQRLSIAEMITALKITGASHLMAREVRHLSGGELQRVLLARAVARQPELLVLDEPAQGVDFSGEIALYDLIKDVRDRLGCGILMISHDLHMVMAATDQVICLNGHVCCQGTPELVAKSPEYRSLFGERAAAALAIYQHHHDHTHLADGRVQHPDGSITEHCHPGDGHHHAENSSQRRYDLKGHDDVR